MATLDGFPLTNDPDALLLAVRDTRDRTAFLALFHLFAPRLNAWMRRGGLDARQAEELVQDVMLRVWHRAAAWSPERGSAAAWMFAIARNARIDAARRDRYPAWDDADPALVADPAHRPDDALEVRREAERIRGALADLPQDQAQVVHAAYFDQRSMPEIADGLGLAVGTVKSRMRLALGRLRLTLTPPVEEGP